MVVALPAADPQRDVSDMFALLLPNLRVGGADARPAVSACATPASQNLSKQNTTLSDAVEGVFNTSAIEGVERDHVTS